MHKKWNSLFYIPKTFFSLFNEHATQDIDFQLTTWHFLMPIPLQNINPEAIH